MRGHIFRPRPIRAFRRRFCIGRQQDAVKTAFNGVPLNINASARVAAAAKSVFLYNRINKNDNSPLITLMHWLETGRKDRTTLISG